MSTQLKRSLEEVEVSEHQLVNMEDDDVPEGWVDRPCQQVVDGSRDFVQTWRDSRDLEQTWRKKQSTVAQDEIVTADGRVRYDRLPLHPEHSYLHPEERSATYTKKDTGPSFLERMLNTGSAPRSKFPANWESYEPVWIERADGTSEEFNWGNMEITQVDRPDLLVDRDIEREEKGYDPDVL